MKAVFLDRDGVINYPVFDTNRKVYRPPWEISEVKIMPNVISSLRKLYDNGFDLFIVTNQPDSANQNCVELSMLEDVRDYIFNFFLDEYISFTDMYYCFHHPYTFKCQCRKPSPYFLLEASKSYKIDLSNSWLIGDRDKDIECGISAGVKTILVDSTNPDEKHLSSPNYKAKNIGEASKIIIQQDNNI